MAWGALVFAARHWIAELLGQRSGIGVAAILTAAAFFVLVSLDRGLLQARRAYRLLAANLLVEGGVRTVAVLVLVAAGKGASGAAIGILMAEMATAAHARCAAVRVWSTDAAGAGGVGRRGGVAARSSARLCGAWRVGWRPSARITCWMAHVPSGTGW